MRFQVVLSKVNIILKHMRTRKQRKLYQQWIEQAGLSPEAVPREEVTEDLVPEVGRGKERQRLPILYMLLGACVVILCVGLILLIVHSC